MAVTSATWDSVGTCDLTSDQGGITVEVSTYAP
jgi:hypothetical protein